MIEPSDICPKHKIPLNDKGKCRKCEGYPF